MSKGKLAWTADRKLAAKIYKTTMPTSAWTQKEAETFFKQFTEVSKVFRTHLGDKTPMEWYRDRETGEIKIRLF